MAGIDQNECSLKVGGGLRVESEIAEICLMPDGKSELSAADR